MSKWVRKIMCVAVASTSLSTLSAHAQFLNVNSELVGADCQANDLAKLLTHPDNPYGRLGWIPYALLENPAADTCQTGLCGGFYYNPGLMPVPGVPEDSIHVLADGSSLMRDGRTEMMGNVQIRDGVRLLTADLAILNSDKTQLELTGNIRVQEPDVLFLGERAILDTVKTTADLTRVDYVVYDTGVHGFTERLQRNDSGLTTMKGTSLSTCEPGMEVWKMTAEELSLDQASGWGEATGATVNVQNTPVLYIPYIKFPIDERRLSGVLWPTLGLSERSGLEVAVPYYFNLAPHYDMTLTPRLMSKRGLMLENQFRYLSEIGQWDVAGAYLASDSVYSSEHPGRGDDRWYLSLQHEGVFGEGWSSYINANRASDIDYFRDLKTTSIQVRRNAHLRQRAELRYSTASWQFLGQLNGYQVMREGLLNPYRVLPRLHARHLASRPNRFNTLIMADFAAFDHPDLENGNRFYSEVGVNYPIAGAAGFFTPTFKYKQLVQNLEGTFNGASNSVSASSVSLDTGLFFDRDIEFYGSSFKQSFEPRMFYLYTPYRNQEGFASFDASSLSFSYQQLFRERRSSSYDRLEDANQLSLGFTSRLYDETTGREVVTLSLGQIYHFETPQIMASSQLYQAATQRSDYVVNAEYHVDKAWRYSADMVYDTQSGQLNNAQLRVHYRQGETLYNAAYGLRRDMPMPLNGAIVTRDLEQIDLSAIRPIDERWKLIARWQYDVGQKHSNDEMLGFEYDSCCWKTQVLLRNYTEQLFDGSLREDTGVFLYIELKGLGGSGSSLQNVLGESIYGYRGIAQERRISGW